MNWHKGNIAEAVALSKSKNAIFVVYVEGKDEATIKLGNFINDTRIREKLESDDFVAIRIESESESYMQFASIFQIVPVPSIFFIGEAGKPLDIATGVLTSIEELEGKIAKVLQLAGKIPVASSSAAAAIHDFIKEESKASDSTADEAIKEGVKKQESKQISGETSEEIVCENGVCFKNPKGSAQEEQKEVQVEAEEKKTQTPQDEEAKLAETRKFLEQKRRERIEEEKRLEKERELRRRKEGKDMQNLRAWQKDQELKELKENIKRERLEEQAARDRIRAQIAADKAERAHKFAAENQATTSNQANTTKTTNTSSASASDESRLQFRLASGASNTHNFKCSTTLAEIRDYVTREFLPGTGIKEFTLATTYPKRELTNEHNAKTLIDLELFPSAVILIIGKEATGPTAIISRNGGLLNMMSVMIMVILNPIFSIFTSAKNWLTGKRNGSTGGGGNVQTGVQKRAGEEQNDVSKRRNLDRFLSGGGSGNTTGTSNQNQGDSSPGSSQGGATRRYVGGSNIHRLSDNRKDSDDENATWNGNSTQQQ